MRDGQGMSGNARVYGGHGVMQIGRTEESMNLTETIVILNHWRAKQKKKICPMTLRHSITENRVGTCYEVVNASGEWLFFNANSAIFQLYQGENKLIFNEMMMRSTM